MARSTEDAVAVGTHLIDLARRWRAAISPWSRTSFIAANTLALSRSVRPSMNALTGRRPVGFS